MTTDVLLASLNAGEVSRLALARIDLAKLRIACQVENNFLPHVLGPAMFRPGTAYTAPVPADAEAWLGEFYYSEAQKTLLVMTSAGLHFLVDGVFLTRGTVTAAVANGTFTTNLASWFDHDEAGAASVWAVGGYASFTGTGTNYAWLDQQVTVVEPGVEHALRIVVARNYVTVRIGNSLGTAEHIDVVLAPGAHSLAFTPAGGVFLIRIGNNAPYPSLLDSITVEAAGIVALPVPYSTSAHFNAIRYDQSGDVLFLACVGFQQRRIERRASNSRSWGCALYLTDDGPFRLGNVSSTTLTPSNTVGSVNLTASRDVFATGHIGSLFRLTHPGQTTTVTLGALNATTGEIRVSGLASHSGSASQRAFTIDITGVFVATITLQRSLGLPGSWTDVESYTVPTSKTFDDGLDNQIIYYRLKCTAYTSGSAVSMLNYNASSQIGIIRLTGVASAILATGDVLREFGAVSATSDWAEGEWSDYRGWPSAVVLDDGRLDWGARLKAQLSVSDAFASFDETVEGDSGPINRTITTGGNDGIRWMLSLSRLIVATATQEISVRASSFDEPLTPTAFTARTTSTRGAAAVRPLKVGSSGIFVSRNAKRVFELRYDVQMQDYASRELTRLKQEMCDAGVAEVAVQMQPDTRLWFVLRNGTCAVLTYDQDDDVVAWTLVTTQGAFERVAVLPGGDEDEVYFVVRHTIGGVPKRYIEKLAKRTEAQGGALSRTSDSHVVYTGAPTVTISGLSHLEGAAVAVWADAAPVVGPFTVTAGAITLPVAASNVVVGLAYTGQIKTTKLAYGAQQGGTALTMPKRISRVGLVMADVTPGGMHIGRDFDHLTHLPATYRGRVLVDGEVLAAYDVEPSAFNGGWGSDSRVCIEMSSPHCGTVMGLALHMETNEPDEPAPAPQRGRG